jgi:threonine dehydrogenase-like Zn-dependent dehydrogenase
MEGLWLERNHLSFRGDLPEPEPGPGEALVKILLAGICATDLELVKGYYPYCGIPGHEFVGRVTALGLDNSGENDWLSRRVVGEINLWCGRCDACRRGDVSHCENRQVLGIKDHAGAFAVHLTLPLQNLHLVPDCVPDEAAVFVEPLAAALEISQQVQIHPEDRVLVIGAGRLGQLIAQSLALTGCRLQVVARHHMQRKLLEDRGIAAIREEQVMTGKSDIVVEAAGIPAAFKLARKAVRPRGTIVMKSTYKGEMSLNMSSLVVDEIELVGSRCGPFGPALRLLEAGLVDPLPLIDRRFGFNQGVEAFEYAARPGVMKVILQPC